MAYHHLVKTDSDIKLESNEQEVDFEKSDAKLEMEKELSIQKKDTLEKDDFRRSEDKKLRRISKNFSSMVDMDGGNIARKFMPYQEIIDNLTGHFDILTKADIIECLMSNDNKVLLLIIKDGENEESIKIVLLDTEKDYEIITEWKIAGDYIKASKIIQSYGSGEKEQNFALPYLLDGMFRVFIFNP